MNPLAIPLSLMNSLVTQILINELFSYPIIINEPFS